MVNDSKKDTGGKDTLKGGHVVNDMANSNKNTLRSTCTGKETTHVKSSNKTAIS